ncbi:hypothetical protein [Aeromicrobium sp.]
MTRSEAGYGDVMEQTIIAAQFNGPDNSGNGGYVCGLIADRVPGHAGVRTSSLRTPPPLDIPLVWEVGGDSASLIEPPSTVIGTAIPGAFDADVLPCPTPEQAQSGHDTYPGFAHHPFDRCFTCGTQRRPGDGLRLFTGPITDSTVAGPWTPHEAFGGPDGRINVPVMWAALDCPGGWAADFSKQPMVLGRMTAEILRRPTAGEPCLSIGGLRRTEGRKYSTNTALYSVDGELLGHAEQIWISIDLRNFS